MASIFQISPPLSQSVGYGLMIGLAAASCLSCWLNSRYRNEVPDSEIFMTVGQSVKTELIESAMEKSISSSQRDDGARESTGSYAADNIHQAGGLRLGAIENGDQQRSHGPNSWTSQHCSREQE
jgi:hypothetical protein